jgi:hypothetical protein
LLLTAYKYFICVVASVRCGSVWRAHSTCTSIGPDHYVASIVQMFAQEPGCAAVMSIDLHSGAA